MSNDQDSNRYGRLKGAKRPRLLPPSIAMAAEAQAETDTMIENMARGHTAGRSPQHANGSTSSSDRGPTQPPAHVMDVRGNASELPINQDLIYGAENIGAWLGRSEKQVYNLHARTEIPIFPLPGCGLAARESALREWISRFEREEMERKRRRRRGVRR